jgi:hypothetical protein
MTMPTKYEVDAVIEDVCEAVLEDGEDFPDLDSERLFTIVLACFAVSRQAAVAALGSDDEARAWFERTIAERWRSPESPG